MGKNIYVVSCNLVSADYYKVWKELPLCCKLKHVCMQRETDKSVKPGLVENWI